MDCKRILIFEVNWIGDVLFSTPFIRAVRNNFPDAYIACAVVPGCQQVLEGNPYINEIIVYSGNINFLVKIKKYNFDTVFLLHRSFTRALLVYLAGIPGRIGYYTKKRSWLLTKKPMPESKKIMHRAEYYLKLIEAVGLKTDISGCDFLITRPDLSWAENYFRKIGVKTGQKVVVLNPGGNWLPKRWPAENFAKLGVLIRGYFNDSVWIILTGSNNDFKLDEGIARAIGRGASVACGETTLKQSAALFKKADVVVANDSGPFHIAVASGAKAIGLYGPTSPDITGPYRADSEKVKVLCKDAGCRIPCYDMECKESKCMSAITPQEVFEQVRKMIE